MTINDAMKTYRLPNPTTSEDLECHFSKTLNFGDRVLLAGYYYNGMNEPCWYGAVYEHLDDDLTCEGTIGLMAVSEVEFEDEGHAIAWAMESYREVDDQFIRTDVKQKTNENCSKLVMLMEKYLNLQ